MEQFGCFFAVDHKSMSGICTDEPLKRAILKIMSVLIQPLAVFIRDPRSTLHFAKPNRIDLSDQWSGNAGSHSHSELRAQTSG